MFSSVSSEMSRAHFNRNSTKDLVLLSLKSVSVDHYSSLQTFLGRVISAQFSGAKRESDDH